MKEYFYEGPTFKFWRGSWSPIFKLWGEGGSGSQGPKVPMSRVLRSWSHLKAMPNNYTVPNQLLNRQLHSAQAFVFKPFQIVSPILTSISHENAAGIPLTSKKYHLAKFCKVYTWNQELLFTGKTSFSLTFPRSSRKYKNRLTISLYFLARFTKT